MMTVSRLLKSWATPPASWPNASIFCDWRSCASSFLRLGDVQKSHHRADDGAIAANRIAPVFDREGRAVRPPEHLIIAVDPLAPSKRLDDGALFLRIRRAVGPGVVSQAMHILAQELIRIGVTQEPDTSRVGECALSLLIDLVNGLGNRIEQEADVFFSFASALSLVRATMICGRGDVSDHEQDSRCAGRSRRSEAR